MAGAKQTKSKLHFLRHNLNKKVHQYSVTDRLRYSRIKLKIRLTRTQRYQISSKQKSTKKKMLNWLAATGSSCVSGGWHTHLDSKQFKVKHMSQKEQKRSQLNRNRVNFMLLLARVWSIAFSTSTMHSPLQQLSRVAASPYSFLLILVCLSPFVCHSKATGSTDVGLSVEGKTGREQQHRQAHEQL